MLGLGEDRLSIYLNDHLAGATAGLELARRAAASNRSSSYGRVLDELAGEIEADREALVEIMRRLSVREDRLKLALAWGAEKAGRLKPNGTLVRYSSLSRLEELEGLSLGVAGKLALWHSLLEVQQAEARLREIDLEALIKRARSQRQRLERQRKLAAADALR